MSKRTLSNSVVVLLMVALVQGCGGDDAVVPLPPDPGGFPDTPAKLMQDFQSAYEAMDYAMLSRMMHPDFVTVLQPSTLFRFPDVSATLDVTAERRIHERMFSRAAVVDPEGQYVPGIDRIQFLALEIQGVWGLSPANDVIPGTECATYNVIYDFDRGPSFETLSGQGSIKFYVTHRDSTANGITKPYYQMRGQVDLTFESVGQAAAKGVEPFCWGTIKAMFR